MINSELSHLRGSPFDALRSLLDPLTPAQNFEPLILTIGEPQHKPPQLMIDALRANEHLYGKYPPVAGTPELRAAITKWLTRRYSLSEGMIEADQNIAPVNGTKEALYMIASVITERAGHNQTKPVILLPTPYYHVYHAAAVMAGAEPMFLAAGPDTHFFPDLDALAPELLDRASAFYLCNPSNPQGTVASAEYLKAALELARKHDFMLIVDECYSEIYDHTPPTGILEICKEFGGSLDHMLAFHSLSKRSSAAGLRSGFCVGEASIIKTFLNLRNFAGAASPLPVCAAATALWNDDDHAEENRALYRQKFDIAEEIFGSRFGFYRPEGGFFLWLDVGDGVEAAKRLWTKAAIRVLPGHFLSVAGSDGVNPGDPYIRVALVAPPENSKEALTRLANSL
ncbi:aminotransferase class I/II-fold pyridoxal phosphate-dependent enzyme [Sneathiella litorea]|uniref:Aminotransferase class I/II-fold pyridoxal phosphate-dependent enzyme n=1 Tax=Sneathiella litorea TaxID=2606216 RepID=A0A6L8W4Y1_9PROT|nr:aminotransferase class I/II-fold pyridoxal phosphate-dependent enzyme [Sneathiella litorea]MZR29524.1 aminotransferase class I/II-fold pyridoxal phosphate-dependent enzyme [Sneathiella litorea]